MQLSQVRHVCRYGGPCARIRTRRGQSVVEYLLIVAAVIMAIAAITGKGTLQDRVENLLTGAINRIPTD